MDAGFVEWLRTKGLPNERIEAFRFFAAELAKHPSLSAAIRAYEDAGEPPQRITNLRHAAAKLVEYEESRHAPAVDPSPPRPRTPSAAVVAAAASTSRLGCSCRKRYDIYLDSDFGALARWLGGGIGIGSLVMIRLFGIVGAAAIALGLAGTGGAATILSICFRCEGCRQRIRDLDRDELAILRSGRAKVTLITVGLLGGAAVCGLGWWMAISAKSS